MSGVDQSGVALPRVRPRWARSSLHQGFSRPVGLPALLSGAEIADELTVSVNTVKSHIRSIYTKLGVSTRRDAVQMAQQRQLLT